MFKQDKEFIEQYLMTALWSSSSDDGSPLDEKFSISDIDLRSIKRAIKDCLSFIKDAEKLNLLDDCEYSTAGHDFWLTRNGHGAGFWDGDYPISGDDLTNLSDHYSEINCIDYVLKDDTVKIEII